MKKICDKTNYAPIATPVDCLEIILLAGVHYAAYMCNGVKVLTPDYVPVAETVAIADPGL